MENREINEELTEVAHELIKTEEVLSELRDTQMQFIVLNSDNEKKNKGRLVFGQCERIPDKYKWIIPYDFTVTIFTPNVERLNEEQMRILLLHELMHIGVEPDGNDERHYIKPHDVEDFSEILKRYGLDWANDKVGEAEKPGKRTRRPHVKGK